MAHSNRFRMKELQTQELTVLKNEFEERMTLYRMEIELLKENTSERNLHA